MVNNVDIYRTYNELSHIKVDTGMHAEGSSRDIHEPSPTAGWTGFMNVPATAFGVHPPTVYILII